MSETVRQLTLMAEKSANLLKSNDQTIAVAESSAGGLVSASLLSVPGASSYFLGGVAIYTRNARRALLGLPEEIVTMRAATEEYAMIVARAIREKLGVTWGLCETGASGPTGNSYGDAAGHACFAVAGPVDAAKTIETGSDDREENMWLFAQAALVLLEETLATYS